MLKIRLKRFGKKNRPVYRIVVMPGKTKRQSSTVEEIGFIDPINKIRKIDIERAKYWISVGAQPTYTVARFLIQEKVMKADEGKKEFAKEKGKKAQERTKKAEEAKAEAAPKAEVKEEAPVAEVKEETPKTEETK